jgi:repressor LexA
MTPSQALVLQCVRRYIGEHGWAPTLRELIDLTGINSTSTIARQLDGLVRMGYIKRDPTISRGIALVRMP